MTKKLHLIPSTGKKNCTTSKGPLWILEATCSSFGYATLTHLLCDSKYSFEWDTEQEKPLQQVQVVIQAALSVRPFDPLDPMVLEASVEERDAV